MVIRRRMSGRERQRLQLLDLVRTAPVSPVVRVYGEQLAELVVGGLPPVERVEFIMVDPRVTSLVVEYLNDCSKRPRLAVRVFLALLKYVSWREPFGEVLRSRAELAAEFKVRPSVISEIAGELEAVGALVRRAEGGRVRYFLSPLVATHLGGAAGDLARSSAPKLRLVPSSPEVSPK